jgi:hypothetical protein
LAEIAPGNFRGRYFVAHRQKAWFLPAAPTQGACGASSAISADITSSPAGLGVPAKSAAFFKDKLWAGCIRCMRLRRFGAYFSDTISLAE